MRKRYCHQHLLIARALQHLKRLTSIVHGSSMALLLLQVSHLTQIQSQHWTIGFGIVPRPGANIDSPPVLQLPSQTVTVAFNADESRSGHWIKLEV